MTPCIAIFDIGRTNKKFLLFDDNYQIIKEEEINLSEILDDDGFAGEDIAALVNWLKNTWKSVEEDETYQIKAVNYTTYGASMVHLDKELQVAAPLYNYLKPFSKDLEDQFYANHGDKNRLAAQTSSPPLGMLNSGLQLYWLKYKKPESFKMIRHTLHLPQFVSFLFTGKLVSDYTSTGCHTMLWDFEKKDYHDWVYKEDLNKLLAPIHLHNQTFEIPYRNGKIPAGLGIHDSSSALIPYLKQYKEPFLLLSTGTWGITLNPFAVKSLTTDELQQDCLQFLTYQGKTVKASRKLIGSAHEDFVKRLAAYYKKPLDYYKSVSLDESLLKNKDFSLEKIRLNQKQNSQVKIIDTKVNITLELALYNSYESAYHQLIYELVFEQAQALLLAAEGDTKKFQNLLVDGGFSRNPIFMGLLHKFFPSIKIKAGKSAQGTALGAALVLEDRVGING
jgi:sugar (pentulose or hexulose) kinase